MKVGSINKKMGRDAEIYFKKHFIEMGFKNCQVSSQKDKFYDNANIDLLKIPFNISIKAGKQSKMNPGKELLLMKAYISSMFDEKSIVQDHPNLLIHAKTVGENEKDEIVYMSLLQFDSFKKNSPKLEYLGLKSFNFSTQSEFKHIVWIKFMDLKNLIIINK